MHQAAAPCAFPGEGAWAGLAWGMLISLYNRPLTAIAPTVGRGATSGGPRLGQRAMVVVPSDNLQCHSEFGKRLQL